MMRRPPRLLGSAVSTAAAVAVLAVLAVLAPGAGAQVVVYASPQGGGPKPCTDAQRPCTPPEAVAAAPGDGQVIAKSGTYQLSATLKLGLRELRGQSSGPRPKIVGPTGGAAAISATLADVRYLDIEQPDGGGEALEATDTDLASLVVRASGGVAKGIVMHGHTSLRSSFVSAGGNFAGALVGVDGDFTVHGVTARASGFQSQAIAIRASTEASTATITNTIAVGDTDLAVSGASASIGAHVTITTSNYRTAPPLGFGSIAGAGNQTPLPAFVDAAGGDFHQAAGRRPSMRAACQSRDRPSTSTVTSGW